ncbi:MAG: phenylalanine--tRNA ligase subunit beta [Chthoniobacter sp.]|uniref:phenylalanine--tRNA ligase subunit beta n=1 Tax=Chthoniobacter sp. TaxID=2510640 RepID=UPI0032A191A0
MKVSLNWLRELVELPSTVPQLVDLLTLAGVEVEGVETHGVNIPNVVVAQIRESVPHPNADRLSVCQVDDGTGTARQIVCGAKNYKVGDKVPLALPGAVLGPDFKIKVGKLRGVESQGMLCSAEELGLPAGEDGLLILSPESKVGAPLSDLFPGDTVLDLEITPNRADLLSHVGIAREIAALTGKAFTAPEGPAKVEGFGTTAVNVEPAGCELYTALEISNVTVSPSPEWLRRKLEAVGLRPINNIVDITNYVMLELGQPLHAFDADKLDGDIRVRAGVAGEEFLALDGKTYPLAPQHIVIADDQRALALGGVMGGEASGVTEATHNIILESAHFDGPTIRRTSRALGLSSDSSYRFERGVDINGVIVASHRAAALILDIAGGTIGDLGVGHGPESRVAFDPVTALHENAGSVFTHTVKLRTPRVAALLGLAVPPERIDAILTGFGLLKAEEGWEIPSFRPDLTREIDLIEEIARVVGIEAVPARVQAQFAPASATDRAYDRSMSLRRALVAQGFAEARTLMLIGEAAPGLGLLHDSVENRRRVKNPMNDEQVILRPGLLPGLLQGLRDNLRAGAKTVRLFEAGRVFSAQGAEESTHLACVFSGVTSERCWRGGEGSEADLFHLKGVVSAVLGPQTTFVPDQNSALALALVIQVEGQPVGFAGQLWPKDARGLDATAPVLFAEIDLSALPAVSTVKKYREIPRFPATARDIALLAPLTLAHAQIEQTLRSANEPLLAEVELFDVFADASGIRIPADKKSVAYSLTYRSPERTLTADEVNAAHTRLKERLKAALAVTLRE